MHNILDEKWTQFSYHDWYEHFKENDNSRLKIDFSNEPSLTKQERDLIFPSISAFQKGEHSEGACFLKLAEKFKTDYNEPDYPNAVKMFIKEENFHSSYLAQYMDYHDVTKSKNSFFDRIFRKLRHSSGLFAEISVLVTAEIVALSYYSALGNVADKIGSSALRSICNQMLHDELPHIVFQSYTLSHLSNGRKSRLFRKALMEVTTALVYCRFRRVMKQGKYNFLHFRKENFGYLQQSFMIASTKNLIKEKHK